MALPEGISGCATNDLQNRVGKAATGLIRFGLPASLGTYRTQQ